MRIVSLVPAATEWIHAFGGGGDLIARSHRCDFPPEALDLPVVSGVDGRTEAYWWAVEGGEDLCSLQPDLVVARDALPGVDSPVFQFAPETLKQVLNAALTLGQSIGRSQASMQWLARAERDLAVLQREFGLERRTDESLLPSVLVVEDTKSVSEGKGWMADAIRMAGGRPLWDSDREVGASAWEEAYATDPDVLLVVSSGLSESRSSSEKFRAHKWQNLLAVRTGRAFLLESVASIGRPGPRLYDTIARMARAIHAEPAPSGQLGQFRRV